MKALIIASGQINSYRRFRSIIREADLVICADGGTRHARQMSQIPTVVIGDLDSMAKEDLAWLEQNHVPVQRHPTEKDASDTELSVEWALANRATDITFIGTTGSRLDHTLASIMLLKPLVDNDIPCRIIDDTNEIYLVTRRLSLSGQAGDFLSIIPLSSKVTGITLEGLAFPLINADIPMGSSLGISNRFVGRKATISIRTGILAVTKSRD